MTNNGPTTELRGTLNRFIFSKDETFRIASVVVDTEDNGLHRRIDHTVTGNDHSGELAPGIEYRFLGQWVDNPKYGKQFKFDQYVQCEPNSRGGVVGYLKKNAPGVGPVIASRLWDSFQHDAVRILRTDPEQAASQTKGLTFQTAREASAALELVKEHEETKIDLTNLLQGRGFPSSTIDNILKQWKLHAPKRIKKDPFCLLVAGFAGAGFSRCDALYIELGHNPAKLKRQMLCVWNEMRKDMQGHTWFSLSWCKSKIEQLIGSAETNPQRALKLGVRSKWLSARRDGDGQWWFSEKGKAGNERVIAEVVRRLLAPPVDEDESVTLIESEELEESIV